MQRKDLEQGLYGVSGKTARLNLLELNDDCLIEIAKRASLMDLCSLAKTSVKLEEITIGVFRRSHRICNFNGMALKETAMVQLVLNTFGSTILELRIDLSPYKLHSAEIVDSILRHCTEIKSLTMKDYVIPDTPREIAKMRHLFGKLQSLDIYNVSIERAQLMYIESCVTPNGNLLNLFGDCHSLVELKVDECWEMERSIFDFNFPKLERMFYQDPYDIEVKGIREFVLRHSSNLRKLRLGYIIYDHNGVIDAISANCKKLQYLEFEIYNGLKNATVLPRQLGALQQLNTLKICWHLENINELLMGLQQSTSIRELQLEWTSFSPNSISTIGQIKTLRILKLLDVQHLHLNALQDLTQLVELFIFHDYLRIEDLNFDVVNIVQRLANLKKLKLDLKTEKPYTSDYRISQNIYDRLVDIVGNRRIVENRYLKLYCRAEKGLEHLPRPTIVVDFRIIND